jgi:hypothetical protein
LEEILPLRIAAGLKRAGHAQPAQALRFQLARRRHGALEDDPSAKARGSVGVAASGIHSVAHDLQAPGVPPAELGLGGLVGWAGLQLAANGAASIEFAVFEVVQPAMVNRMIEFIAGVTLKPAHHHEIRKK